MIKTIIFDNHGVLITTIEETGFDAVAKLIGSKIDEFIKINNKLAEKGDIGKITTEDFFQRIVKKLNIDNVSPQQLENTLYGNLRRKENVIKLAAKIGLKYEIVLLTDFSDHFWAWNKKWRLDKLFSKDKIFVSSKLKMHKPQKRIFLYVLKKLKRKPAEVLFIDDYKNNVDAARNLGINSIHFASLEKLKQDLRKYIKI